MLGTIKKILGFIAAFAVIKAIFFVYHDYVRIQNDTGQEAPTLAPLTQPETQQSPTAQHTSDQTTGGVSVSDQSQTASQPGYHRYAVGDGISVNVSDKWTLLSQTEIIGIKKKAGTSTDAPTNTPVAANSSPYENHNEGVFRASIGTHIGTANDIKSMSRANLDDLCKKVSNGLINTLPKQGNTLTRNAYCSITTIANKTALSIGYQRTGAKANGLWEVFIYQVPLPRESLVITTSYKNGTSPRIAQQIVAMLESIQWQ